MRRRRGFTIIELLVAVAIIAILATAIFINLSKSQAKSRDAKRISDMNEIGKLIQRYAVDLGDFPDNVGDDDMACIFPYDLAEANEDGAWAGFWFEDCLAGTADKKGLVTEGYIDQLPADPLSRDRYRYLYSNNNVVTFGNKKYSILQSSLEVMDAMKISGSFKGYGSEAFVDGISQLCEINPDSNFDDLNLYCLKVAK